MSLLKALSGGPEQIFRLAPDPNYQLIEHECMKCSYANEHNMQTCFQETLSQKDQSGLFQLTRLKTGKKMTKNKQKMGLF